MESNDLQSIIGLNIQCAGILLITILSFFITRSIHRIYLNYWAAAWVCLSVALSSLSVAFAVSGWQKLYFTIYFLGEYAFGYLFIAGCRNYASGARLRPKELYLLIPATGLAVFLSQFTYDFNVPFIPHAAIIAVMFGASFYALRPARNRGKISPGLRVMSIALMLLTIDFLHYVPVLTSVVFYDFVLPINYLKYTSIYDLILEILLGFGALMAVMDNARHEVEAANHELVAARDRLEVLARIDPLTEALNRHAFYSLLDGRQGDAIINLPGCAVVLDIDNLKPINDSLGHAAGDVAIREVARSIRSIIRADDLLFRWGGDEFLILLFNLTEPEAYKRFGSLNSKLAAALPGATEPVPLIVSYGLAQFSTMAEIEQAIDKADAAMYAQKQSRKMQELRVV